MALEIVVGVGDVGASRSGVTGCAGRRITCGADYLSVVAAALQERQPVGSPVEVDQPVPTLPMRLSCPASGVGSLPLNKSALAWVALNPAVQAALERLVSLRHSADRCHQRTVTVGQAPIC